MTAIEIRLDLHEVQAIADAWATAPDLVAAHLLPAVLESQLLVQREVVERTPRGVGAGGGLAGSISAREPELGVGEIVGVVGTPLVYAEPVELGTRPHFPPMAPLRDWVRHKLGKETPEEIETVARAIQRKIGHHGTQGAFMFRQGLAATQDQVVRILTEAVRSLLADLAKAGP